MRVPGSTPTGWQRRKFGHAPFEHTIFSYARTAPSIPARAERLQSGPIGSTSTTRARSSFRGHGCETSPPRAIRHRRPSAWLMPKRPYLDASVQWRINSGQLSLEEPDYRSVVEAILSAGLATEVVGLISAGKEANVYLARYNGAPLAIKSYRLYRTSHRGGGPVKQDSMGWRAAHEYEMMRQAWKSGVRVPTPARRVENRFSMRYIGTEGGPAPRLKDVLLDEPSEFLYPGLDTVRRLIGAGVVHGDLSAFNILVHEGEPWVIDFSEAIRVDRAGSSPWVRLTEARAALESGLAALQVYFRKYDLRIDVAAYANELVESVDRFGVLR